jgi:hypothetical protein
VAAGVPLVELKPANAYTRLALSWWRLSRLLSTAPLTPAVPAIFTVAERAVAPPLPVQVSVYVLGAEMELMVSLPDVTLTPDQAPDAVQLEALLEDQVSRVEPPAATVVGAALSETVGAGGGGAFTLTVTDRVVLPPVPVQIRP